MNAEIYHTNPKHRPLETVPRVTRVPQNKLLGTLNNNGEKH